MAKTAVWFDNQSQVVASNNSMQDPSKYQGLLLWLDASERGSITESGGEAIEWKDLSFRKKVLAPAGSLGRSEYVTSEKSIKFISFTTAKYFQMTDMSGEQISNNGEYTLFLVCKVTGNLSNVNSFPIFAMNTTTGSPAAARKPYIYIGAVNKIVNKYGTTDNNVSVSSSYIDNKYGLITSRFTNGIDYLSANNDSETSYPRTAITGTTPDLFRVGNLTTNSEIDMYVREVLYYTRNLSTQEITNIKDYLNKKWSLY